MDILPLLAETCRVFIPHAPKRQKVAFAMEKGGVLDLPQNLASITVGLGWDVDDGEVDLDVSAVLLDANGNDLEAVFFGRLESELHGIQHTGDNLTGEGEGDDEQIICQLERIGPVVQQVYFVVNIYSQGKNFTQVAQPYCRVVDDATGSELCRYALRDAGHEQGLIVSKIAREAGGRWGFHALGLPCRGRCYKDSLPQIKHTAKIRTASLALRTQGTGDLSQYGGSQYGGAPARMAAAPPESGGKECCALM